MVEIIIRGLVLVAKGVVFKRVGDFLSMFSSASQW